MTAGSATALRRWIKGIRPSNMVLLAAVPFIIYLFASSRNYQRSLVFILGIEDRAGEILLGFLVLLAAALLGAVLPYLYLRGRLAVGRNLRLGLGAFGLHLVLLAAAALAFDLSALLNSIVAAELDPRTTDWLVEGGRPPLLSDGAMAVVTGTFQIGALAYGLGALVLFLGPLLVLGRGGRHPLVQAGAWLVLAADALIVLFLLLYAHLGFSTGLMITLRATFFSYGVAAILGLIWALLVSLKAGDHTLKVYSAIALAMIAASAWFLTRPQEDFALIGGLEGRIAIIKGTPQSLTDQIRFGDFPDAPEGSSRIRSVATLERALELMSGDQRISAAFLPEAQAPAGVPVLWRTSFLADQYRYPAYILGTLGVLLVLLTFGAWHGGLHPLAVFAEFFIDTIRGIPMLVIILYIGLPLSGAIKDATGGALDMPNMMRGVVAISIGYSAYMAEIFRAGIEAIPKGQIEAARSLGLKNWLVARLVILPQAIRIVIPPLGNEFIAMLKDTSLLSILSVRDVTQRMREFQSSSFLPFEPFNTAAILYVGLTLAASSFLKWIERRSNVQGQ
jgi:polar amino acid transport system permease protein